MQLRSVLLAVVVVLAAGPALAAPAGAHTVGQSSDLAHSSHSDGTESENCTFPYSAEDASPDQIGGPQEVTVEEEPQEVVVLAANVAQHMWEIGAEEKVIGMPVNDNTAYLPGSESRTHIYQESNRGFDVPNSEKIVELDPDLVLSPSVIPGDAVQELRDAGLTVYHYPVATNFTDVMTQVERTGRLVGACDAAKQRTQQMADRIALVENATADVEEPSVFYDLSQQDRGPRTVNSKAFEHNLLDIAGAENIAADVEGQYGSGYPLINQETVLEANPDIVISPGNLSDFAQERLVNQAGAQAIQIDANYISQHAPRTVDVLVAVAEELHPDEMEAARAAQEDDSTDGEMDGNDGTDGDDEVIKNQQNAEESADDGGPGFAVGAAVAALLALALVATRRQ
ncbi:ABC transporter substrate-binding protein [Halovenus halobia]|uniref:ABC transporter substrate-binding protein n=1 Tax=Halovenus halobia TaxID=3396622 RepID=UPI003F55AAB1